jgi:hypothetical protein
MIGWLAQPPAIAAGHFAGPQGTVPVEIFDI